MDLFLWVLHYSRIIINLIWTPDVYLATLGVIGCVYFWPSNSNSKSLSWQHSHPSSRHRLKNVRRSIVYNSKAKQNWGEEGNQIAIAIKWLNRLSYHNYIREHCTGITITELQLNVFKGMNFKQRIRRKKSNLEKNAFSMIMCILISKKCIIKQYLI